MYDLIVNMEYGKNRSNPSDLARALILEFLHRRDQLGPMFSINDAHIALDNRAKSMLMESGLGGGGCSSVGTTKIFGFEFGGYAGC
jgi:hypothetical protein